MEGSRRREGVGGNRRREAVVRGVISRRREREEVREWKGEGGMR